MQDDKTIIIDNWLLKSEEALEDAKKTTELDMLYPAQNRLYYSIFYAVMALARFNDFKTSKHSQLLGWFNHEFIKTGKIDIKYGKLYRKVYDTRMDSDYTYSFKPKKEVILEDIEKAREFINVIKQNTSQ